MSKVPVFIIVLFIFIVSCGKYTTQKDIYNHHLISQLGYVYKIKPGVRKIEEVNKTMNTAKAAILIQLLPEQFIPNSTYSYSYNENGTLYKYLFENKDENTVEYEFDRKMRILSIAGYSPYYLKEIFEYYPDGYMKYIFRENGDDVIYKYSPDFKTVSYYKFKPVRDGNKHGFKTEKLLAQVYLKKLSDDILEISKTDADNGQETEKYTYLDLNLIKKETADGINITYNYNDYGDIIEIIVIDKEKKSSNYKFDYYYDDHDNWIDRQISLDSEMIIRTERNISYY